MQDRYTEIKDKILSIANKDTDIKAIIAIGSSVRSKSKADVFSDLDLIVATDNTEQWIYGDIPEQLGSMKISFVEDTLGGAKERRVLYENALDVDMIAFTPERFITVIKEGIASWVCNRGYSVLYDAMGAKDLLDEYVSREITHTLLTEAEYINMVNDFCFHVVWASKKLLRGEIWSAKMCIDSYLKNYLLKMMEMHCAYKYNIDVWHDGRFLDKWADDIIKESLPKCFAHYDSSDMITSLSETKNLFVKMAKSVAKLKCYSYPETAINYADEVFNEYFKLG